MQHIVVHVPDCPADLLDEFLVPGEPQGGEGSPKKPDEARAECNKAQNLEACAVFHSEGSCKRYARVASCKGTNCIR